MSLSVLRTDKREEIVRDVGFYPRAEIKIARLSSSSGLSRWPTVRQSFPPCDLGGSGARVSARPFCLPISTARAARQVILRELLRELFEQLEAALDPLQRAVRTVEVHRARMMERLGGRQLLRSYAWASLPG